MRYSILIFLILIMATACDQSAPERLVDDDDVVLVEVDGHPVTVPMLEHVMTVRGVDENDPEGMRELLDELIRIRVMANAAESEGLDERKKVRAERAVKDMEILYVRYLEKFQREHPVTDEEIEQAYREQVRRAGDRQYRVEALPFPDQAAASTALASIRDGEQTFEDAAAAVDAQIETPGWIDGTQVSPDFGVELERTEAGEVVDAMLPMQDRWLLMRVAETRASEPPPLEEVREGIHRTLTRERSQGLIDELYEEAEITPMLPVDEATAGEE